MFILLIAACGDENSDQTNKVSDFPKESLEFPIESFTIAPNKDTTLFGIQGTRVFLSASSFRNDSGQLPEDSVEINIREFYSKADILLADLSTQAGDRILETGGMIYIEAVSDGQKLQLDPNKPMIIHFPKKESNRYKEMGVFYSDQANAETFPTNWEEGTQSLFKQTLRLGSTGWWHPAHDDSTGYSFRPKDYIDTGYYWNPIDFYVKSYVFSDETIDEVSSNYNNNPYESMSSFDGYGVECEMKISTSGYIKNPKINSQVSSSTKKEILQFIRSLPQLEPGTNKHGEIIERGGFLFIQTGRPVSIYETNEEYVKSFNSKYAQFENNPIRNIDDAELEYFIFSSTQLGWINCDRFIDETETIDMLVDMNVEGNTKLKLVFSEIDGVLMANQENGKYIFRGIPLGENATIVGIKNSNDRFESAFKDIRISKNPVEDLVFEQITLGDLRSELEKL